MVEEDAVPGDPVKGGRFADIVIAVGTGMGPAPVVGYGKDDIRLLGGKS